MSELRPFALIRTGDQWARCAFDHTALDLGAGVVGLELLDRDSSSAREPSGLAGGLAFDRFCRLYRVDVDGGNVERVLWAAPRDVRHGSGAAPSRPLLADDTPSLGDFAPAAHPPVLNEPRGIVVDANDRLFVAETGAARIVVYDLWSGRLLRRVYIPSGRPGSLAARGTVVYAVLPDVGRVVTLTANSTPVPFPLPAACTAPSRIAVSPGGTIAIVERSGRASSRVWIIPPDVDGTSNAGTATEIAEPWASDVAWESDDVLVVARGSGDDFVRFLVQHDGIVRTTPLHARGYDGLGITAEPIVDGRDTRRRIIYWTAARPGQSVAGPRAAVPARLDYETLGRVTTYRLDSGAFQTVWGRVFLDACVPKGTAIRIGCVTLDELPEDTPLPRTPPANLVTITVGRPDLSPPMPPAARVGTLGTAAQLVHRRESGREIPWAMLPASDGFETYEAPIIADAGRYLWITIELRGTTRLTPRVRCLRAEHPSHDYLQRLPRTFSRDERAADFLHRYLAMFDGFLGETEARAVDRHALLEPRTAPDEALPWLASFVGLVLDERWANAPRPGGRTVDARRIAIREAISLFRARGTVRGLARFIEIYTGVAATIIEHFRLRAIGGSMIGADAPDFSMSVLGGGFRVGGPVGLDRLAPLAGTAADAFRRHAHRFTVIIPAPLSSEELDVVRTILAVHRPAHTIFDLCTVDAGMRAAIGLHIGLTSVIGPTAGWHTIRLGESSLGRSSLLGRPGDGASIGMARLDTNTLVG